MSHYDMIVIGGGPAGVTAALRARELGASVALVERGRIGGTCTNDGCVPTRVLAKAARLMRDVHQFADYGLELNALPTVNIRQVLSRTQEVVYTAHEKKQLIDHLMESGVDVIVDAGDTSFIDAHTLNIPNGEPITGDRFVIAVGGSPRRLGLPGAEFVLTHSDVWSLEKLPKRIVIVGSGATGCQLASIFNAFGSTVTILEVAPRILLSEDADVAASIKSHFMEHGIAVQTGISGLERIEQVPDGYTLVYNTPDGQQQLATDAVILSVGWPGNINALNMAAAGIDTDRNFVVTNDNLQTTAPHIFAAGDITGRMMLVQSATYQARLAVENALLGTEIVAAHRLVPHGGFTDPEYGGVGLTEAQARQQFDVIVATVPYANLDRAVIDGHTEGFCKLIVDRETERVIGAHVVGEQAVEIVSIVSTGMAGNLSVTQFADLELAYPTFSAVIGLAARQIVRELGIIPVLPEWRELAKIRASEWERLD